MKKNYYHEKKYIKKLKKSKKTKIVIFVHKFGDSFHTLGNGFFENYRKWFDFLEKIINQTNYTWYIKKHPSSDSLTELEVSRLIKRTNTGT